VEALRGIISTLEQQRIPVVPLKGPALAEMLYTDPSLRPFTDLDVLVRRDDLPATLQILAARGYRPGPDDRPFAYSLAESGAVCLTPASESGEFPLDVHWQLLDPPGLARAPAIDATEVWNRMITIDGLGRRVLAPCPEDLLIYLAAHLALHHPLSGLRWQLDLALLIRSHGSALDWDAVLERARRWRLAGALSFALTGVRDHFGMDIPPPIRDALRPRGLRPFVVEEVRRRRDGHPGRFDHVIPLLVADRRADLARALVAGIVPPARWVRQRYARDSVLRAYAAHWARIGRICARTVRGLLDR
jgi:hypothetical protein